MDTQVRVSSIVFARTPPHEVALSDSELVEITPTFKQVLEGYGIAASKWVEVAWLDRQATGAGIGIIVVCGPLGYRLGIWR